MDREFWLAVMMEPRDPTLIDGPYSNRAEVLEAKGRMDSYGLSDSDEEYGVVEITRI